MLTVRPLWKFTAFMLPLFFGCLALGMWQLQRLQWKLALIAQVNRNLNAPAIPVERALARSSTDAPYRRVVLIGRFDHSKEAYVFGTDANGAPAYHVITPFTLDDGRKLLVDRGIVPERLRDPRKRRAGLLQGEQRITGVWRIPDAPGVFAPASNIRQRIWYARDVRGLVEADHIRVAAPAIVEADAKPNPGGWPKGGQTVVSFRNDHLQYAITWFGLAAVTVGGWVAFHISRGRLGRTTPRRAG
ncbi:MAG TPA: SURF1 family protein [Rhizomicrobium sp.]|nr:SURF1 family protein [Rhizomicrobium sp.]